MIQSKVQPNESFPIYGIEAYRACILKDKVGIKAIPTLNNYY